MIHDTFLQQNTGWRWAQQTGNKTEASGMLSAAITTASRAVAVTIQGRKILFDDTYRTER